MLTLGVATDYLTEREIRLCRRITTLSERMDAIRGMYRCGFDFMPKPAQIRWHKLHALCTKSQTNLTKVQYMLRILDLAEYGMGLNRDTPVKEAIRAITQAS